MFACNVSVHLTSLRKRSSIRKLLVSSMLLGSLTGAGFAQRTAPSARPAPNAAVQAPNAATQDPSARTQDPSATMQPPNATTQTPNMNTIDPNVNTVDPNVNAVTPSANTVDPKPNPVAPDASSAPTRDTTQKPPLPPNSEISPNSTPPSPQH
jgi:hypothetical protein